MNAASRQRPSRRLGATMAIAASLVIGATGTVGATTASSPGAGGDELTIARNMDLTTLDPARAYCNTCPIYLAAVYETLVGVDSADLEQFVPRLAESWEVSDDHTEYTFRLDPDATFADGSPVTAADVEFSWERLAGLGGPASYLIARATVEAPDAGTVVVTFDAPNSGFLAIVAAPYLGVTNASVAIEHGATTGGDDAAETWFLEQSAGSGPFVLESYAGGDELVLARNDGYWSTPSPFPRVTLRQVADAAAQLEQLGRGDVDVAMPVGFDAVAEFDGSDAVTVAPVDSYDFVYLALSPGAPGGEALADPAVREAIRLAIDYDGLLATTVGGHGRVQASPIPNGFTGSAGLALPAQDVEAAAALLAAAGVDGLTLRAAFPQFSVYGVDLATMMGAVRDDLAAIGIDLQLEPLDFAQWLAQVDGGGIPVTAVNFSPDHVDSSQYVQYFAMVEGSPWLARTGMERSPEQTGLFVQALAVSGEAKAQRYRELGQLMVDDHLILPLVNPDVVLAYASGLTNVELSACCTLELGRIGTT